MTHYKYLIVGGGMTADSAVRGIRGLDSEGTIALFSMEADPPYDRPQLSKALWRGKEFERVWRRTSERGADVLLGRTIIQLDPRNKSLSDDQGNTYTFDKLLLATGGSPRRLPFGGDQIIYYRTLADYRRLRALADHHERFAVIGAGFIGSEITAALAMNGKKVILVNDKETIGSRIYPPDLARFVTDYYIEKGVEIASGVQASGLEQRGDRLVLTLTDPATQRTREEIVDAVVAGIGITPNIALAQAAGLAAEDGILVDRQLRATHPDIFAAGDVANYQDATLGRRRRVEHEDQANTMGRAAGRAMAGTLADYDHLPYFYSDLFDLGYEAVGDLDSRLDMVSDWTEPNRTGVIYYMKDQRVRGVLLWNVWKQVDAARALIAEPGPLQAADLKGRLRPKK